MLDTTKVGLLVLRYGLALVFLYFGFSQLFDGVSWVGLVPDWATRALPVPPAWIVLANGLFEVVAATLLIVGIIPSAVAILLAAHLLLIVIGLGLNPTGVRDFGLMMATFALALLEKGDHA